MTRILSIATAACMGMATILTTTAQEPKPAAPGEGAAPASQIEPEAARLLRRMSDFYRKARTATAKVVSTTKVEAAGMKQEMVSSFALAFVRPNKLALIQDEAGVMGGSVVADGKEITTYMAMLKQYSVTPAPDRLGKLGAEPGIMMSGMMHMSLLGAVLDDEPYEAILEGVTAGKVLGRETISGTECDHLRFSQGPMEWDVWIEAGDKPLMRKQSLDLAKMFAGVAQGAAADERMKDMKMWSITAYNAWEFDAPVSSDKFVFQPPEGAKKMDGDGAGPTEEHPLTGKPAPVAELDLLGGGKFDLAAHKGKDVVILDFWATWCGPCVKAMPVLAKVAGAFKERGLVLYAVNQEETEAKIQEFLKSKNLMMAVPLDREGSLAKKYEVTGIPQTVIIDREGVVRAVHVGFSPTLEADLTAELEPLLRGKPSTP